MPHPVDLLRLIFTALLKSVCSKMSTSQVLLGLLLQISTSLASPFVVQTLSSRYGLVLGGYGPGYQDLRQVEVVKHDKVCSGAIKDIPVESARFLGDISGMAEYVNGSVIFCRHSSCWNLNVIKNSWSKVTNVQSPNKV